LSWLRPFRAAKVTLLAYACAAPLVAAPRVEVALEPQSVTLGDRIAATLIVRLDPGDRRTPRFPDWSHGWGKLSVLSAPAAEPIDTPSGTEWHQKLELAAFELGKLDLPAVEIALDGAGGVRAPKVATPPGLAIEVRSVLPAEEKEIAPKPAEPPRRLTLPRSFWWTAAALTALAAALGIFAARRSRIAAAGGARGTLAPLDELDQALAALSGSDPVSALATLSLALRRYLGRSLSFPALESTTSELAQRLGGGPLDRATVQRTVRLLREVDQVKFARRAADAAELARRIDEARSLAHDAERQIHPPAPSTAASPDRPDTRSAA
jgi:hypothetical protein